MIHHRWLKLVFALLLVAALPGMAAALGQEPAAGPPALAPEVEPNDTPWDANSINGWRQARIDPVGDVDYYRAGGYYEGLDLVVSTNQPASSPVRLRVTLSDAYETELAGAECDAGTVCLTYQLPAGDEFYLRVVDANGNGGPEYEYAIRAVLADPHEPNDFLSQATPYTVGEKAVGIITPLGEVDYFRFTGEAGVEYQLNSSQPVFLLDATGNELSYLPGYWGTRFLIEETGTYYLMFNEEYPYEDYIPYWFEMLLVDRPLLLSFAGSGTVGGVAFTSGDVVRYSPLNDSWQMFFDASDMGLRGNLVALDGSEALHLTFAAAQNVPGLGAIRPQDIIEFYGQTIDGQTTGQLSIFVDGSDVGLTTTAESIDALGGWYDPVLSTKGNARLPMAVGMLLVQPNDAVHLRLDWSGEDTQGWWWSEFDGGPLNLGQANLIGLDADLYDYGDMYVLFDRPVTFNGVTLARNDIGYCRRGNTALSCETIERVFDGSLVGGHRIDALAIMPAETP
jgi:hypothetical protein